MSDELTQIRELLVDLSKAQAVHAEKAETMGKDIEQIKHVLLEGNGTPSLVVRVAVAENELQRVKEERDDKKMPRSAWVAIVVTAILALASLGATLA